MEELKGQLKSFIDEATVELVKYPLKEWLNWSNITEEEALLREIFLQKE